MAESELGPRASSLNKIVEMLRLELGDNRKSVVYGAAAPTTRHSRSQALDTSNARRLEH